MKSYLGWPLKLKDDPGAEAHVTLKYLGDSPFTIEDLTERLRDHEKKLLLPFYWSSEIFAELTPVMALNEIDPALFFTRAAVEDLRVDTFPEWRPHISFTKARWTEIVENKLHPYQVIAAIGPLTLFTDKLPVAIFE